MLLLKRSLFSSILIAAILVSLLSWVLPSRTHAQTSPPTQAAVENGTYRFINRGHIAGSINGVNYDFIDINVNTHPSEFVTSQSPCNGGGRRITLSSGATGGNIPVTGVQGGGNPVAVGQIDMDVGPDCQNTDPNNFEITIDATYANSWLYWLDAMTIVLIGDHQNPKHYFVRSGPDSTVFAQQDEGECADKVILSGSQGARLYRLDKGSGQNWDSVPSDRVDLIQPGSCKFFNGGNGDVDMQLIARPENSTAPAVEGNIPGGSGASGTGEDTSCETASGALGWIMCPIAGILDTAVGFLDEEIRALLILDSDQYFRGENESGDNDLKQSWARLRNIAYAMLVPIMLVMVIGTALGAEIFSAYTVKKALPRMVIAIIFISLSWYICLFLVDFVNVIGAGMKGIITAPFEISSDQSPLKAALTNAKIVTASSSGLETTTSGLAAGGIGFMTVAAGFAAGALSLGIIMSTLGTAALILLGVFLLLIARQMILIALFLIAPLAILAWIFPNNDKLWKLWWGSFSKLLLLYPLIMLMLGVGEIFAHVTGSARGSGGYNNLVTAIMVIGAFVMPFFFIPFAFKWAGGVFGNLAGMVNDKERGALDRLKKGRSEKRAQGWQGFKAGTGTGAFQKNGFSRRIGTGIGAGIGGGKGVFGTGFTKAQRARGSARMDQMNRQTGVDQIMKNPAWNGVNQDDNAMHAGILMEDMSKEKAINHLMDKRGLDKAEAERATAAWQASGLGGRAAAVAAAQQLVSTGTGYKNLNDMTQTLARAAGGNSSTGTAMAGFANSETKKVGRNDLAPSFGTLNKMVQSEMVGNGELNAPGGALHTEAIENSWNSGSLYGLANGKPKAMEAFADHWTGQYQQGLASGDETQIRKAARALAEMEQMTPNATGDNATVLRKAIGQRDAIEQGHINGPDGVAGTPTTPQATAESYQRSEAASANLRRIKEESKRGARVYERPDPNRLNES